MYFCIKKTLKYLRNLRIHFEAFGKFSEYDLILLAYFLTKKHLCIHGIRINNQGYAETSVSDLHWLQCGSESGSMRAKSMGIHADPDTKHWLKKFQQCQMNLQQQIFF